MRHSQPLHRAVAVTGLGVVTPIGCDEAALRASLAAGRDGFTMVGERVATAGLARRVASVFAHAPWRTELVLPADDSGEGEDPCVALARQAASDAWRNARLSSGEPKPATVAVVLGTSAGGLLSRARYEWTEPTERARRFRLLRRADPGLIARAVAQALDAHGPVVTISTACTSSTNALVHGRDLLLAGLCDVAVVGGVEALVEEVLAGFHAMGAMSDGPCAPFSLPVGMSIGEGAGFVVLERLADAAARQATVRCLLCGGALCADAWHRTAPNPTGAGMARAMSDALVDAALAPEAVGYVNAHGSGTDANDAAEWRAIERVLGAGAARVPVSSTKGHLGHTLGAAGVLELVATVLCLEAGTVPPTLHWDGPRGAGPVDPVAEPQPRPHAYDVVLKSSAGFGGANASVVVAAASACQDGRAGGRIVSAGAPEPDEVLVMGTAALGPFGAQGLDAVLRAGRPTWASLDAQAPRRWAALVPALPWSRLVRGVDLRGIPKPARYLLGAASLALSDAGARARGAQRERMGLFVGAWRPCWEATRAYWGSIRERGFERASAPAFGQIVLNAVAGIVSTSLDLRGPLTVVAGRGATTLGALVLGREALARRRDAELLVVGASAEVTDEALEHQAQLCPGEPGELSPFDPYGAGAGMAVLGEGSACLVLAARRALPTLGGKPLARVAGTGAAGAGRAAAALHAALTEAGWTPRDVDAVYGTADGTREAAARELEALRAVLGERLAHVALCNLAPVVGTSSALDAFALSAATEALRVGRCHPPAHESRPDGAAAGREPSPARRVVVVGEDDAGGSWAVALAAPAPVTEQSTADV